MSDMKSRENYVERILRGMAPMHPPQKTYNDVLYGLKSAMIFANNLPHGAALTGQLIDIANLIWDYENQSLKASPACQCERYREVLAELLKWCEPDESRWNYMSAIEHAKSLLATDAGKEDDGWIDVNNDLPEYGKGCLLIISNGMMTIGYLKKATETSIYRQWQLYGELDISLGVKPGDEVTHWRPLPAAPQKVNE